MKRPSKLAILSIFIAVIQSQADPLRFTSGYLTNQNVLLCLAAGSTNIVCELQRLDPTTDTWVAQSTFTITNGTHCLWSTLTNGYGYFRARATNDSLYSTNAFGAMSIELPPAYSLIGNPFNPQAVSVTFPYPRDGLTVSRWTNSNWQTATYDFGEWDTNISIQRIEGAIVFVPGSSNIVAQFSGIFATNSFSRTLPAGWSLATSPLYHLNQTNAWQVDTLSSPQPGGIATLPVNTSTNNLNAEVSLLIDPIGPVYDDYSLVGNSWFYNGSIVDQVGIIWSQGFWYNNVNTNSVTWTVNHLPIW